MNKSEKAKEAKRKREKVATENLADSYIRKLLRSFMLRSGVKIRSGPTRLDRIFHFLSGSLTVNAYAALGSAGKLLK